MMMPWWSPYLRVANVTEAVIPAGGADMKTVENSALTLVTHCSASTASVLFILNPVPSWPIRYQYLIMWSVTDQSQSSSLCVRTVFQHFNCPITGTKLMWKIAFQRVKPIQFCSCLHWWTFVSGFLSFVWSMKDNFYIVLLSALLHNVHC